MISWSPTGQLTCSPTCLASWKIDSNLVHSLNLDKAKTHLAFEWQSRIPPTLPNPFFWSCLEVCVVCLQATSQLWPVWPTWGDGEGLVVTSFRVLLWKCVRFERSSCPLTTGWTYPIEAGHLIVGFAPFFECGHIFAVTKTFGKREVCQVWYILYPLD